MEVAFLSGQDEDSADGDEVVDVDGNGDVDAVDGDGGYDGVTKFVTFLKIVSVVSSKKYQ